MQRINKALADAGVCSRRKADELIQAGAVRVNGVVVSTPGIQVSPETDRIEVHGKAIACPDASREPCYLLLHKPIQVVSTVKDPEGRTTVLDLVPEPWKERRLYPAGRLDFFSEGLLLLTDDGALTNRITHPSHHLPRLYHVLVREDVSEAVLTLMREGMTLAEGEHLASVKVRVVPVSEFARQSEQSVQNGQGASGTQGTQGALGPSIRGTLLELELHQGLNRQIRRMCRDTGLTILKLVRVAQGPLRLGDLPVGSIRHLTPGEVRDVRQAVDLMD